MIVWCVCVFTGSFPWAVLFSSSPRWRRLPWQQHQPYESLPFPLPALGLSLSFPTPIFLSLPLFSIFFSASLPLFSLLPPSHTSKQATSLHLHDTVGPRPDSLGSGSEIYGKYGDVTHFTTMQSHNSSINTWMDLLISDLYFTFLSLCPSALLLYKRNTFLNWTPHPSPKIV